MLLIGCQGFNQYQLLSDCRNEPVLSTQYIKTHSRKHMLIYSSKRHKFRSWSYQKLYLMPNNRSFSLTTNWFDHSYKLPDYTPNYDNYKSYLLANPIKNFVCAHYHNNKVNYYPIRFWHAGYNQFHFHLSKSCQMLSIPIFRYHGEHAQFKFNGQIKRPIRFAKVYGFAHVKRGTYDVQIKPKPSYQISDAEMFTNLGVVILFYKLIGIMILICQHRN